MASILFVLIVQASAFRTFYFPVVYSPNAKTVLFTANLCRCLALTSSSVFCLLYEPVFLVYLFRYVTFGQLSFFLSGFLFKCLCCLFSSRVWRNKLRTWRFKKRRNVEFYHLWQSLRSASPFYIAAAHAGIYSRRSLIGWNHTLRITSVCE